MLGRYRAEEKESMALAVRLAADSVEMFVAEGIVSVMNRYNRAVD